MSGNETDFAVVLRGYERGLVDDAIRDLKRELLQLSTQNAQLATELRDSSQQLQTATEKLKEVGDPSYTGVGARAALILGTAEDQAVRLIAEAETERSHTLANTLTEVEELRFEAKN